MHFGEPFGSPIILFMRCLNVFSFLRETSLGFAISARQRTSKSIECFICPITEGTSKLFGRWHEFLEYTLCKESRSQRRTSKKLGEFQRTQKYATILVIRKKRHLSSSRRPSSSALRSEKHSQFSWKTSWWPEQITQIWTCWKKHELMTISEYGSSNDLQKFSGLVIAWTYGQKWEETDFGQSRFGHPDWPIWANQILANQFLAILVVARPILAQTNFGQSMDLVCVSWWGQRVGPRKSGAPKVRTSNEGAPKGEGWGPNPKKIGPRRVGGPKFRVFSISRHNFRSFCFSLVWIQRFFDSLSSLQHKLFHELPSNYWLSFHFCTRLTLRSRLEVCELFRCNKDHLEFYLQIPKCHINDNFCFFHISPSKDE